ncbi:hypothetical protein DL771_005724 [Monosporascus sp. 5C6A]|nr:hypothetical protein DL771_005724 [Monosporascus sp. 5C6A]
MSGIKRDVKAREDRYQQVEDEVKKLRFQNQKTNDIVEQLNEMMIQFLDAFHLERTQSPKSPKIKASGLKEVPIAVKSDVEEINPLREGETKPKRWSIKKPDAPKRVKNEGTKKPPPKEKSVAREVPDDSDNSSPSSSSLESSGDPPKKRNGHHSSPSSSSGSDSSSVGVRLKEKSGDDLKLRWKRFDFTLDKENHLSGWVNWELWSNALSLSLKEIGYEDGMKLKQLDQLRLAKAVTKTCKRAPLKLITGIKKGTKMLRTLRKTYAATGKARQRSLWKELSKITYDGGDPIQFTTKFQKLLRNVRGCGMRLGTEEHITMFLSAVEDRAGSWCKTMQSVLRQTDYSFQQLIDDFNSEFHDRTDKKKNNRRSHNTQKDKGGNNNSRDNKPAWNKNGEPLCFNCGKYGHLAKDCPEPQKEKSGKGKKGKRGQSGDQRQGNNNSSQNNQGNSSRNTRSGGQDEEQFIPEGLRDLYRSSGGTFSAHVNEQQLQELMQWYDGMIKKEAPGATAIESTEAIVAESTEAIAIECPGAVATAVETTEATVGDCPEATVDEELQEVSTAVDHPGEVDESPEAGLATAVERTEATTVETPEATKAVVVGSAMVLLRVHSSMEDDREKLLWDSGANVNITNNIRDFERNSVMDIRSKGIQILTGGGPVVATSVGTVKWPLRGPRGEKNEITVKYTLCIDTFPLKIFSGEMYYRRGGYLNKNTLGYGLGEVFGEDGDDLGLKQALVSAFKNGKVFMTEEVMKKIILWHRRLCHPSTERLIWTIKRSTGIDLDPNEVEGLPCTACDEGKIRKIPSIDPQRRVTFVGEIIWCDVGSVKPVSIENNSYFGFITDDFSRCREYYSFRTKDEVQESLCGYITRISRRLEASSPEGRRKTVQILRLDGGREFGMTIIEKFCAVEGIELVISSSHNQYQNGVAERGIQFLQDEARATSAQMKIPTCFWNFIMEATTYTINRTGQSTVKDMTPIECFERAFEPDPEESHKPDNSHLRILGSRCTVLIDKNYRTRSEKLAARGAKGMLLGYQGTHNYKVWLLEGGRMLTTPHVTVYEDLEEPGQPPDPRDIIRSLPQPVQKRLRHRQKQKGVGVKNKDGNVVSEDDTDQEAKQVKRKRGRPKKTVPELYTLEAPDEAPELLRELKLALTQEGDCDLDCDLDDGFQSFLLLSDSEDDEGFVGSHGYVTVDDGPSLKEAMESPEREMWLKAIFTEIKENLSRGTFCFITSDRTYGHLVDAKWVLRKKYTSTGELDKYKARICARGFTQRKGIDYNETAASTARAVHWRILMALAAYLGWHIIQIDFIAAYLNGNLKEDIYMKQFAMLKEYFEAYPEDREKYGYSPELIIKLMNPLYGLKQAGATWQEKVRELLAKLGFLPLISDDAIYRNAETGDVISSYVDDFLLFGAGRERLEGVAEGLAEDVPVKDLGDADWYLGVRLVRSLPTGDVRLDQQQYIEKLLKSVGLNEMRKEPTPFVKDYLKHAVRHDGVASKEDTFEYASLVGKFNFFSYITRPDTAFATSTWARFMGNPSPRHQECIKRLPRYLNGTGDLSLRYRKLEQGYPHLQYNDLGLFGAVDTSFADDQESAKSTTGCVFFMAGAPVSWFSKLQGVVTRCTIEAEYVGAGTAAMEVAGIRNFLTELKLMPEGPISILEDNIGAFKWVTETQMSRRKRHIRVEYHYVRQEVQAGNISFQYVESKDNPADGLTKPLDRTDFERFIRNLGFERIQDE